MEDPQKTETTRPVIFYNHWRSSRNWEPPHGAGAQTGLNSSLPTGYREMSIRSVSEITRRPLLRPALLNEGLLKWWEYDTAMITMANADGSLTYYAPSTVLARAAWNRQATPQLERENLDRHIVQKALENLLTESRSRTSSKPSWTTSPPAAEGGNDIRRPSAMNSQA